MDEADQQALTGAVIKRHSLDLAEVWLDFVALGGDASEQDIRDYSSGTAALSKDDRDALNQAVNEHCAAANALVRAPFSGSLLALPQKERQDPYSSK
ncbi:hypothetical protein [Arthrobacter sp. P2b]|uniref:hypothetical protein n=1 Tax=Arthrobacter sp. P2b TaxID=1938741 RepID=UPI0009A8BD0A|nr:hypothetical protein [Arthrobacter sp. P2b]SLK02279.1 hypothetical protein SAMN06272721_10437 [Arthrobacter sp. P2b]